VQCKHVLRKLVLRGRVLCTYVSSAYLSHTCILCPTAAVQCSAVYAALLEMPHWMSMARTDSESVHSHTLRLRNLVSDSASCCLAELIRAGKPLDSVVICDADLSRRLRHLLCFAVSRSSGYAQARCGTSCADLHAGTHNRWREDELNRPRHIWKGAWRTRTLGDLYSVRPYHSSSHMVLRDGHATWPTSSSLLPDILRSTSRFRSSCPRAWGLPSRVRRG
jgi:hypothetical protein